MPTPPTFVTYTGDGSTRLYTFPFEYLRAEYVFVTVNGDAVPFTFNNASTVNITTAPVLGAAIRVFRYTERGQVVDFVDGSVLLSRDLDFATVQLLHIAQENGDAVSESAALEAVQIATAAAESAAASAAATEALFTNGLLFRPPVTIDIPASTTINIPAGVSSHRHITYRITENRGTSSAAIVVQSGARIDELNILVAAGVTSCDRGVSFQSNVRVEGDINVTATDALNIGDSNHDGFVQFRYSDVRVNGRIRVHNARRPVLISGCDGIETLGFYITGFEKGVVINYARDISARTLVARDPVAGHAPNAGNNGLTVGSVQRLSIQDVLVSDSPEHAVYLAGNSLDHPTLGVGNGWVNSDISIGTLRTRRSRQCGLKIKANMEGENYRSRNITIGHVDVLDASYGSTAGSNEDGVRIEYVRGVSIGTISVHRSGPDQAACFDALYINGAIDVDVGSLVGSNVFGDGVHITDAYGDVSNVRVANMNLIGVSGHLVNVDMSGSGQLRGCSINGFGAQIGGSALQVLGGASVAPSRNYFDLTVSDVTGPLTTGGGLADADIIRRVTAI